MQELFYLESKFEQALDFENLVLSFFLLINGQYEDFWF